ncbi:MAG TPA: hypothetical protein VLF87_02925, partial [Patescibacteria group bacterium]|nr:hypothetical protein [Patescibacteria group bacterium]
MSPTPDKDTIYIDAEDEITDIIDKLQSSPSKVVALVLPKRASSLQSIVNLKLLKRTSETAKKNLVLITSDHNLLPLAGVVGLHVAKTPQSKPLIPPAPTMSSDQPLTIEDNSVEQSTATNEEPDLDPKASIGQLAGQVATEETIELDNDEAEALTSKKSSGPKAGKNKKLRVPDFDRFRLLLFGGIGLLLLLIVGLIFALVVLPRAKITIKTDTTTVNVDLNLQASTDAKAVNVDKGIVPALNKQVKKTDSEKVPATGQRDDGTKASGKVTLSLTDCSQTQVTIPAGTVLTANSLNFVTQTDITLNSVKFGPQCRNSDFPDVSSGTVSASAQSAGDKYNLSARAYVVNGFANVSGNGKDMSGGTSKITQIVSQQDVDNAKQKVLDRLSPVATTDMKTQFDKDNATGITDTFSAGDPAVTSSPNVNDTGSDVTVNVTVTYSEFGVK